MGQAKNDSLGTKMSDCGCGLNNVRLIACGQCGHEGCRKCMIYEDEEFEYFCDSGGPDDEPKTESECRDEYIKEYEEWLST